jgi:hypothetical protein
VSAIPDVEATSAVFHVREIAGTDGQFQINNSLTEAPMPCKQVDVTGFPVANGNISLKPFESKFFRVRF